MADRLSRIADAGFTCKIWFDPPEELFNTGRIDHMAGLARQFGLVEFPKRAMESIRRAMLSLLGDKRRLIEFKGIFGVTRIPFAEESKHIKAVLDIPEDYEVACYLALG